MPRPLLTKSSTMLATKSLPHWQASSPPGEPWQKPCSTPSQDYREILTASETSNAVANIGQIRHASSYGIPAACVTAHQA